MNASYEGTVRAVVEGFANLRALAPFERAEILAKAAVKLGQQSEEIARLIVSENAKPIRDARIEVQRAQTTFAVAAEEARRIAGEMVPLDGLPAGKGKIAFTRRFPIGPVAAITPFNFPLNLVAHKVAPAIAAGCSVLVKPSPRTPKTAAKLLSLLRECGLPEGIAVLLEGGAEEAQALARDDRFAMLSFTGSAAVGWQLKSLAGKKRVCLELGGNAACIVHADADLDRAAERLVPGSFAYSGQVCISTQRIFLHESIRDRFLEKFLAKAKALRLGDPMDESTDLGPMIDEAAAIRAEEWIREAKEAGAKILLGGPRRERFLPPTVLADAPAHLRICCEEVFAPVVVIESYREIDEAFAAANASRYGLQTGLFTNDLQLALRAHETLEAGAVLINEIPGFRVDSMPYGGTKESGLGREGVRYAIEEMTEPRLLVLHRG